MLASEEVETFTNVYLPGNTFQMSFYPDYNVGDIIVKQVLSYGA
jgi:hypothetical protein